MASRGINKVILIGNLGQDPDIRNMSNGVSVANITLATSDNWIDKKTGEQKEKTEWHKVVIFGKLAEIAGEYLRKGSQIYIEGSLQTKKWQDNKGYDRYTTEIIVNVGGTMQMLGNKSSKYLNNDQTEMWYSKKNIINNQRTENNILDENFSKINENDLDYDDLPF